MKNYIGETPIVAQPSHSGLASRRLALEILCQNSPKFKKELLDQSFANFETDIRDRHLVMELVYGILKHYRTLEHILKYYSKHNSKDEVIQNSIYLGLYQLLFMEKIPTYAAINTSVELLKKDRNKKIAGFANALLRKVLAEIKLIETDFESPYILPIRPKKSWQFLSPVFPDPKVNLLVYRAIAYSYPDFIVKSWEKQFGSETCLKLLVSGNSIMPIYLRPRIPISQAVETLTQQGIDAQIKDDLIQLPPGSFSSILSGFEEGKWLVMGPAAANVIKLLNPQPGTKILDMCAAPGSKTIAIGERILPDGSMLACDISKERLEILKKTIETLKLSHISTQVLDCRNLPADLESQFDQVILDAPCSNSAVLARRPEARWRLTSQSLASLAQVQRQLLEKAAKAVKPGGTIVYSTCSLESQENHSLIAAFLQKNNDFECLSQSQILPLLPVGDGGTAFLLKRKKYESV